MAKLTYLSHSCFEIATGGKTLLIDPFMTGNPKAPRSASEFRPDYVLLTHGHGDHLGDAIGIAKSGGATVVAPFELATYCGNQGCDVHPMHIGGGHDFDFGRLKLTIAHHGSTTGEDMGYGGSPCGLLITAEGKTLYHAGDTGLFYDMKLIGEMHPIDVALLPIGDNFTMGPDDAVKAAELLGAKLVVPMHYDTFDLIAQDPEAYCERVRGPGAQARVLAVGESMEY